MCARMRVWCAGVYGSAVSSFQWLGLQSHPLLRGLVCWSEIFIVVVTEHLRGVPLSLRAKQLIFGCMLLSLVCVLLTHDVNFTQCTVYYEPAPSLLATALTYLRAQVGQLWAQRRHARLPQRKRHPKLKPRRPCMGNGE